ncbi:uncharacterized protein FMAN_13076 [Fusarium mangiferae]|uniref:BZIP domain-containing protein n=1 Tax=Fusarium mangiferae TaxID=192010 RepID=A0A1L7T7R9_FUSMA|nr:uncharacterized protein FMAN_13076 [Fusarium mangiferae]CVK94750.1 uncharacterized protein FMAN_13076 [Fusarium mangiferae]
MSGTPITQYCRLDSSKMPSNEDDWHGVTNPVERKKRQNRLRQRAWRARKQTSQTSSTRCEHLYQEGYGMLVSVHLYSHTNVTHDWSITDPFQNPEAKVLACEIQWPEVNVRVQCETHRLIPPLLQYSTFSCAIQPPSPIVFPLSADHCLITLVQYNVVRALLHNMSLLSLLHHLPPGCRSSFGVSEIDIIAVKHIPSDLQTTSLQRSKTPPLWVLVVIICATGFDVSHRPAFPVPGRGAQDLRDCWNQGPIHYLSVALLGFLNFFRANHPVVGGPNAPISNVSLIMGLELAVDYIFSCVRKLQTQNIGSLEVKREATDDFLEQRDKIMQGMGWTGSCVSWYKNGSDNGAVMGPWCGSIWHYKETLEVPRWEDFEIQYLEKIRFAYLGNGRTHRELSGESMARTYLEDHGLC